MFVRVTGMAADGTWRLVVGNPTEVGEKLIPGEPTNAVPLRAAVCGEPDALSATLSDAVRLPAAVGANLTEMVQVDVGASGDTHPFVWA